MTNEKDKVSSVNSTEVISNHSDCSEQNSGTNSNQQNSNQEIPDTSNQLHSSSCIQLDSDREKNVDDKDPTKLSPPQATKSTWTDCNDFSDGGFAVENTFRPSEPSVTSSVQTAEIPLSGTGKRFAQITSKVSHSDEQPQILQSHEELQAPQLRSDSQYESNLLHLQYHAILTRRQQDHQQWIQQYLPLESISPENHHDIHHQPQHIERSSRSMHEPQTKSCLPSQELPFSSSSQQQLQLKQHQSLQHQQNLIAADCETPSIDTHDNLSFDDGRSLPSHRHLATIPGLQSRSKLEITNQKCSPVSSSQNLPHPSKHQMIDSSSDIVENRHDLVVQQMPPLQENNCTNHHRHLSDENVTNNQPNFHHFLEHQIPQTHSNYHPYQPNQSQLDQPQIDLLTLNQPRLNFTEQSTLSAEQSTLSFEEHIGRSINDNVLSEQQEQQHQPYPNTVAAGTPEPLTGLFCYDFAPSVIIAGTESPRHPPEYLSHILSSSQSQQHIQKPSKESELMVLMDVLELVRRTPFDFVSNDRALSMSKVAALPKPTSDKTQQANPDQDKVRRRKRQRERERDEFQYSSDSSVDGISSKSRKPIKEGRSNLKCDGSDGDENTNSGERKET